MRSRLVATLAVTAVVAAGCGSTPEARRSPPSPTHTAGSTPSAQAAPVKRLPLRPGERRVRLRMPTSYTPHAPTGVGTDDYRCFLLDPHLAQNSYVTGFNILPGNPEVVHHVILFRVPPDFVGQAKAADAADKGEGWTCFGNSGVGGRGNNIDDAPWLGAWAPGGSEQEYGKGLGEPLPKGSKIVMQVHYNLLVGDSPDRSAAELRVTPATRPIKALQTVLLPAPVELPCRAGHTGSKLCNRAASIADTQARFGMAGGLADLLHLLCSGGGKPGPVQSCTRPAGQSETIRGVAGHMHLLGKSIKIEVNPGTPRARTILDIKKWDFDNQGSRPIKPVQLGPQDTIKVTCRHSQALRDRLPAFHGQPDKWVVWGEGTTDEMCLGILLVTRP